jgi:hypothetical protein
MGVCWSAQVHDSINIKQCTWRHVHMQGYQTCRGTFYNNHCLGPAKVKCYVAAALPLPGKDCRYWAAKGMYAMGMPHVQPSVALADCRAVHARTTAACA